MRTLLLLLLMTGLAFGAAPDIRISDKAAHVATINSDGSLSVSTTNEGDSGTFPGSQDVRICDDEGHCVEITAGGALQLVVGSPY